jgi:hypothetical protein
MKRNDLSTGSSKRRGSVFVPAINPADVERPSAAPRYRWKTMVTHLSIYRLKSSAHGTSYTTITLYETCEGLMRRAKLLIFALALVSASQASAQSFCEGIEAALQSAESGFAEYQGEYDPDLEEYTSTLTFDDFSECMIDAEDPTVTSLKCQKRYSSQQAARSAYQQTLRRIEACFGGDLRRASSSDRRQRYIHRPSDNVVIVRTNSFRTRRGTDVNLVIVEVEFVEANQ